jgi:hypothetical protein
MTWYILYHQDQWTGFTDASLNVVNAQVLTGAVVTTNSKSVAYLPKEMLVKHDFIRYISNNPFQHLTDLFSNETELITDLNNLGDTPLAFSSRSTPNLPLRRVWRRCGYLYRHKWRRHVATDVQSSPPIFLVNFWGRCTRRPPLASPDRPRIT